MTSVSLATLAQRDIRLNTEREPGDLRALDLIDSWAYRVVRMFEESSLLDWSSTDDLRTLDDFYAALNERDGVEKVLAQVGSDSCPTVDAIDALFRAFTFVDENDRLRRAAPDYFGESVPDPCGWWWSRLPRSGPIAADADRCF
jgi:hypothetical protein